MRFVLPIQRSATVATLAADRDVASPGDWITVSTGCVDRPADPSKVRAVAAQLAAVRPECGIFAFTSGLSNVRALASALGPPVRGIFYDYEPNYPNEPEFTFDLSATQRILEDAMAACHAHGLELVGYLTGQALFHPEHQWNYSLLRSACDTVVVQTQAALRHGRWEAALERLATDFGTALPHVQVTVTPSLPNAVDVASARTAWQRAAARGFPGCVVWWLPESWPELVETVSGRK